MDAHALSTAIRWVHVVAMAVALGGSVLLAMAARSTPPTVALAYERAFWIAAGILAMTGVGNAAAFGLGLPGPASAWGATFTVKLVGVLVLVLLSLPRSVVAAQLAHAGATDDLLPVLRYLYAATALWLIITLALAVWMSHG